MEIRGIEVENVISKQSIIYECPYCTKKFINKNSYYTHLDKKYCRSFNIEFEKIKNNFNNHKITEKQFYEECFRIGYLECVVNPDDLERIKTIVSEELFNKIESMYDED